MTIIDSSEYNYNDVFKELLNDFSDFILFIDSNGVIEKSIGKLEQFFNFKIEIVGENIDNLFSENTSPQLTNKLIQECIHTQNNSLKTKILYNDKISYFKINIKSFNSEKKILYFRNITEFEKELRNIKSEGEKYHSMLENSHAGIWVINKEAYTVYVNKRLCNLFGYNKNEMLGKHLFELMSPESKKLAADLLQKRQRGVREQHRFEFIKKDGTNIFTRLETSPILDKDGKYDGAIAIVSDITELVYSEFELLEAKETFEAISQQAFISIVILQDDRFKYFNDEFLRVVGYTREEVENWGSFDFLRIIHPDCREFVKEQAIKKQRGDKDVINEYEFKGLKKNGEKYWVHLYSKTVQYEGNNADLIITLDITKRRKAEEKLRLSEEKYRDIAELLPDAIYEADKNLNIVYVNSKGYQIFGYSPEDLEKGINIRELIVDDYKSKVLNKVSALFSGELTEPNEYLLKKKDGTRFYGRVHSRPIYKNGSIIGLRGTISDITEMVNAKRKLKKSEDKFRKLYTNIPGAMLLINQDQKIIDANKSTCELTGYSKDELLAKKCTFVCSKVEEICLIENPSKDEIKSLDTYIKAKNGNIIPVLKNIKEIEINGERLILENFQDITQKKQAEETLKKVNLVKTELMRRASHELKTPLVSIKGFTGLLLQKNDKKFDEDTISTLKEIEKGCERLQYLINDILETSKLDSGNVKLRKSYENLTFLIRYVVKSFQGLAELRNITIEIDIQDGMITFFEKERMYEVLGNLISNAIKYTPEGGKINIYSEVKDEFYIISVRDNGVGFTNEEKEKIFKQFGKVERYGKGWNLGIDGSGLGLYISKKIIEYHGGEIWMESKGRNKGSTFFFSLPISKKNVD